MSKYGTLIDTQLHPAPRAVRIGGAVVCNPSAEDFARLNAEREAKGLPKYYPISDDPAPTPPDGKVVRFNGYAVVAGWIAQQYSFEDAPPPTLADYDAAMEQHLYEERAARGYTTREPDAYINSSVPRWAQDARDWVAHRDAVMGYALALINQVEDGERDAPTMAEFKAGLPTIEWTYTEVM